MSIVKFTAVKSGVSLNIDGVVTGFTGPISSKIYPSADNKEIVVQILSHNFLMGFKLANNTFFVNQGAGDTDVTALSAADLSTEIQKVFPKAAPVTALPTEYPATYAAMQASITADPTTKRDFFVTADETNGGAKTLYRYDGSYIKPLSKNATKSLNPYNETLFSSVTIVDGAANASTAIANSVLVSPNNSAFRYTGGTVAFAGASYPDNLFYKSSGVTSPTYSPLYSVEFDFDGLEFELYYKKNGGYYRLNVNGLPVTTAMNAQGAADGSLYLKRITFADRQIRRIKIECANNFYFGGVRRGANDTVFYPSNILGKKAVIMGDSFTEQFYGYGWHLGRLLGWQTPLLSGVGGTGYLNPGTGGKVKYRDRVQSDVIAKNPDVVIVQGGINDSSSYTAAAVGAEAGLLFDTIRTGLPFARLIVLGVISPSGSPITAWQDVNNAIKTEAENRGLIFINPIADGWITGTWNVANSGNAVNYTSSDGIHPTEEGGRYLGARIASKILALASDIVSI